MMYEAQSDVCPRNSYSIKNVMFLYKLYFYVIISKNILTPFGGFLMDIVSNLVSSNIVLNQ